MKHALHWAKRARRCALLLCAAALLLTACNTQLPVAGSPQTSAPQPTAAVPTPQPTTAAPTPQPTADPTPAPTPPAAQPTAPPETALQAYPYQPFNVYVSFPRYEAGAVESVIYLGSMFGADRVIQHDVGVLVDGKLIGYQNQFNYAGASDEPDCLLPFARAGETVTLMDLQGEVYTAEVAKLTYASSEASSEIFISADLPTPIDQPPHGLLFSVSDPSVRPIMLENGRLTADFRGEGTLVTLVVAPAPQSSGGGFILYEEGDSSMQPVVRAYCDSPDKIIAFAVDMNGDGKLELFSYVPEEAGAMGIKSCYFSPLLGLDLGD